MIVNLYNIKLFKLIVKFDYFRIFLYVKNKLEKFIFFIYKISVI